MSQPKQYPWCNKHNCFTDENYRCDKCEEESKNELRKELGMTDNCTIPLPNFSTVGAPMGWICPKCGRCYSPTTSMCYFCCNNTQVVTSTGTGISPIENKPVTSSVTITEVGINNESNNIYPRCICGSTNIEFFSDVKTNEKWYFCHSCKYDSKKGMTKPEPPPTRFIKECEYPKK